MIASSDETKQRWPYDFRLILRASFGAVLKLELVMSNTGSRPLRFEEALHAYFRVGDIGKVQLNGLANVDYLDKTAAGRKLTQQGSTVISSETDRVYLNTTGAVAIDDSSLRRRITVGKQNSHTTVVWNPWIDKAKALSDFGDTEWQQMVCVEVCNVGESAVDLAPGAEHTMGMTVSTAALAK